MVVFAIGPLILKNRIPGNFIGLGPSPIHTASTATLAILLHWQNYYTGNTITVTVLLHWLREPPWLPVFKIYVRPTIRLKMERKSIKISGTAGTKRAQDVEEKEERGRRPSARWLSRLHHL